MHCKNKYTKIIFTIGPATEDVDMIADLISAGADICRLNMAHANHDWTRKVIANVREASKKAGRDIALMMDVKGPEIRTGNINGTYQLNKGDLFDVYANKEALGKPEDHHPIHAVDVNYPGLIKDVKVGDVLLVDNGLIQCKILEKFDDFIRCKIITPGTLKSKRHINLPGVKVSLPSLTEKDKGDIKVGIEAGVEFFALSFVREPNDITTLRDYLIAHYSPAHIIAKIEDQSAISNLEDIIKLSDGLMIARGDLGVECPFEQLPIIQKRTVQLCIKNAKPVIIATHMLESMIQAPLPTRAEVTDVANAIIEKADGIMLSAETTIGEHPLKCIEVMRSISCEMEKIAAQDYNKNLDLTAPKAKMLLAAVVLAHEVENPAVIIFSNTGSIPQVLSALRPMHCAIYAFTENPIVRRQMNLLWGVHPFLMKFSKEANDTVLNSIEMLKEAGLVEEGRSVVVLTNTIFEARDFYSIQLRHVK